MRALRRKRTQRGVAIISALLVVSLAAILVSGMLWRQEVQIRRIENQRLLAQAQWISRSALDWTRLILRSEADTSPTVTYLGGVWGVPIAKTKLSDFLGQIGEVRAQQGASTYLSGSIEDAQAKFNLRNLVSTPTPGVLTVNVEQIQVLQRLFTMLGVNGSLAKTVALQMRAGLQRSATRFQTQAGSSTSTNTTMPSAQAQIQALAQGGGAGSGNFTDDPGLKDADSNAPVAPLQMISVDSLLDVPGFSAEAVAKLRPFITVLPTTSAINMNTAPAEVIAAVVPGMNLSQAQAFVARRETVFFHDVGNVQLALTGAGVKSATTIDPNELDVTTKYFVIHGRVEHERAQLERTTLVYRDPTTHTTRIVYTRDTL
ncbi:general secretion pathway protein K [Caballeronia hypogeia]|uniref:General secretion pathway protein K n=2 Tax=Caballeronia hypogeia TaxID=1777140 RepID=A0A157Z9T2_9BURK|nr:general secretion pathway protein K [Caballeronia hypogeia]